jgi:hypothetical protein
MRSPIIDGISQPGLVAYLKARQYDALYWPNFFPLMDVNTLDGKTIIGSVGSRVAAHVISYDAKAPEASRKTLTTMFFDIPKVAQSRRKTEKEILEHQITRAIRGNDAVIEDYFNDIDFCFDSCNGRIEWMALQALSTTKLQLNLTNNPMGIINEVVIDFGMPTTNKYYCQGAVWSTVNAATMTPLTDIKNVLKNARKKGITFERILIHPDTYDLITGSTEFLNACKSLLVGESQVLGLMSLDITNKVLTALRIPPLTLIETSVAIEGKNGVLTETNPWDQYHLTFIPTMALGNLYSGPIAEEVEGPLDAVQAKRGHVLLSIKRSFNPVSIVTKGECNVFPSWPLVDRCYSLYTNSASAWA